MEFTIKLSEQELNLILSGLGELPAKLSFDLIKNIHQQASTQIEDDKKSK